jgi:broad specificity phosphatase PhoE
MRIAALMRHGEPQVPPPGRSMHDDRNRGLTDLGRRQAQAARDWLEGLDPAAVLCSDSPRSIETARIAAAPLEPRIVPGLAGLRLGVWEQRPLAEIRAEVVAMIEGRIAPPEGAETAAELLTRVSAAFGDAIPDEGNVLVVAHRVTNALLIGEVLGLAPEAVLQIPQDHANVSLLALDDSRDQLLALNVSPLGPLRIDHSRVEALG